MINLPTCLDINAECDNEPCEFSHDRKCTFHCRQWKHISPDTQNNPESLPEPEWILPQKRLDDLENKYRTAILKAKEMAQSSVTPGAYLGYLSQGELMACFLFDLNTLRESPKPLEDVLPQINSNRQGEQP